MKVFILSEIGRDKSSTLIGVYSTWEKLNQAMDLVWDANNFAVLATAIASMDGEEDEEEE